MSSDTASPATIDHRIGPAGRLSVKVADWNLRLIAVAADVVTVHDTDGAELPDDLEVERGADSLSIRQPSRFAGVGFVLEAHRGERGLTIEVPIDAEIDVRTASGDVAASGLHGDQLFRTASGELHLDGVAGDLTTETVSGDIAVRVEGSVVLAVKTVSGDVFVQHGRVERVRLTTTSGDVRLTSELGPGPHAIATVSGDALLFSDRGLRITAVTVAGDLSTDLPHTSQGGPGRRSLVVGDGETELQFRSVSGDLQVLDPATAGSGGIGSVPPAPDAPAPPAPPLPPTGTAAPAHIASSTDTTDELDEPEHAAAARLEILRALESGEIDVAEATDRLAELDGANND